MPRPRGAATPTRTNGQPHPALIIALVFMSLVTILLGVLYYLERDKRFQADESAKKANNERKSLDEQLQKERDYFQMQMRKWLSGKLNKDESDRLDQTKDRVLQDAASGRDIRPQWFRELEKTIEADLKPGPGQNYQEIVKNLRDQLAKQTQYLDETRSALKKVQDDFQTYQKQYNADVVNAAVEQEREKHRKDLNEKLAEKDAAFKGLQDRFAKLNEQHQKLLADAQQQAAQEIQRIREDYNGKVEALGKLEQELKRKFEARAIVRLDDPKGRIVRVTRDAQYVYLDVGSEQFVRPGLTFAVHGIDRQGRPIEDPKAKVEVVAVEGPRISLARVTEVARRPTIWDVDLRPESPTYWISEPSQFYRIREPLVAGDLIYNPAWDPGQRVRVALVGIFDIDGDGLDDREIFEKFLQDTGADVVAYLDPADNTLKGKVDYAVDYLIVGPEPVGSYIKESEKVKEEARKHGIEIVALRKFLIRMGVAPSRFAGATRAPAGTPPAPQGPQQKPDIERRPPAQPADKAGR